MKLINRVIIGSVVTSSLVLAQTQPNIGTVLNEVKKTKKIEGKEKKELPKIEGIKELKKKDVQGDKKIEIKSFNIEGNYSIPTDELQALVKKYENNALGFQEIIEIANVITKYYRDKGYFVARAYIPKQSITKGVLTIRVIESEYGVFELENKSKVKDFVLQGFLNATQKTVDGRNASVYKDSLERTLLLINDLSGVKVSKVNIKAGVKQNSSDFEVSTESTKAYDGYVLVDNNGGRYTGKNRMMGGINFNSPFLIGDELSFNGLLSSNADILNGGVNYSFPIFYNGLMGTVGYSQTEYELGEEYANLDATGSSKAFFAEVKYPLIRKKFENLYVSTKFDSSLLEDKINGSGTTKKDLNKITFTADYDKAFLLAQKYQSSLSTSSSITLGDLKYKDEEQRVNDEAGADTHGTFSKWNFNISNSTYITPTLSVDTSFSYQHTLKDKNLDGSEDFSIGGSSGVKLYPNGEISAENGYLFNIETKYQLPTVKGISNKIGLFYDIGRTYMSKKPGLVNFEARQLQDAGISYYMTYKDMFLNFYAAYKIDGKAVTSEPDYNDRYLVTAGWSF